MKRYIISLLIIFSSSNVFGVVVTNNIANGCSTSQNFIAQFQAHTITCSANTYLPANTEICVPCLSGHVCSGGTFPFNENKDQGIKLDTIFTGTIKNACPFHSNNMYATFSLKSITCDLGYYLVADDETCTACPAHGVCPGGTYTFSETETKGLTGCESGYNLQNNVCIGNIITIDWFDALAEDISANNAGTMTYGGDIRTPRAAIDKTNIGLRFKGWKFNKPI